MACKKMGKHYPGSNRTDRPEADSPSELNIVLLGRTGAGKSASGNTIVGEKKFESKFGAKSKTRECKEATALVSGRRITVLDTPGLYDTMHGMERFEHEKQKVEEFFRRGRCIVLLVIDLGRFTEEEEKSVEKIWKTFPEEHLSKCMILFTNGDRLEGTIVEYLEEADDNLQGLLNEFSNRYHVFNNISNTDHKQVEELLVKADHLLEITEEQKVSVQNFPGFPNFEDIFQDFQKSQIRNGHDDEPTPEPLRLVLLGQTGTGKSATGNTILSKDGFESKSGLSAVTKECQKLEGMVCGRKVAVVDTPGFFGNSGSKEQITEEVVKSVGLSAPGPHAFLLVVSLKDRLTAEVKDTIKELHKRFGEDFKKYTIILFSYLDHLEGTVEDLIKSDAELRELLRSFENRIHAFDNNNRSNRCQVSKLLEKIDKMILQNGGGCYTDEVYRRVEEALKHEAERCFQEHELAIRRQAEELQIIPSGRAGQGGDGAGQSGQDGDSWWQKIKSFFVNVFRQMITFLKCFAKCVKTLFQRLIDFMSHGNSGETFLGSFQAPLET